jgi:hypothetical protein
MVSPPFMELSVVSSSFVVSVVTKTSNGECWDYWMKYGTTIHYATGTCVMGKDGNDKRVTVKDFNAVGVEALSVAPMLPRNHTQSTA